MKQQENETTAEVQTQGEFERLIGEPVQSRSYVPKMELRPKQCRNLQDVRRRIMEEARMMGEAAYYGWGAGKEKIEGPSVKLAMAAVRCWGNCSVEAMPLQETRDAYVFTSRFIDLETGFTLERQFRQSKNWTVYGKHDPERKADIRFQIGQSKAARNLVLNALPEWMIDEAMAEAKSGCREKIEAYIAKSGIVAAVDAIIRSLAKEGVTEPLVLSKCGVAKREGLKVDDIVMLRGCLKAIQDGTERASTIFAEPEPEAKPLSEAAKQAKQDAADLDRMLNASKPAATEPDPTPQVLPPTLDPAADAGAPNLQADWEQRVNECAFDKIDIMVRDAMENDGVDVRAAANKRKADRQAASEFKADQSKRKQTKLPGE